MNDFKSWYFQFPLFTRTYITIAILIGILIKFKPSWVVKYMMFNIEDIFRFQIHKLFTHYFIQGKIDFNFIFRTIMINFAINNCEKIYEGPNYSDFYYFISYVMILGNVFAWFFEESYLSGTLIFALIYVWCKKKPFETVRFYFGLTFKSEYFPWILLAFNFFLNDSVAQDLYGLAIAHSYLFLVDFLPVTHGKRYLTTPRFFHNFVERFITPYTPFAIQQRRFQQQNREANRGGFFQGQGVRLG
ncbi:hypothetical protein pb186bvf_012393 [Paramecium bursaria]